MKIIETNNEMLCTKNYIDLFGTYYEIRFYYLQVNKRRYLAYVHDISHKSSIIDY